MSARSIADRGLVLCLWLGASRLVHPHPGAGHRAIGGPGHEMASAFPRRTTPRGSGLGSLASTSARIALLGSGRRAGLADPGRTA
jgi:hypothetical protein